MTGGRRYDANSSGTARRWRAAGVMAVGALALAVAACTAGTTQKPGGAATAITVIATEFKLEPATITLQQGSLVTLRFVNRGLVEHDWEAGGFRADGVQLISAPGVADRMMDEVREKAATGVPHPMAGPGQEMVIQFVPATAGAFRIVCEIPGHKEAGMVAQLVVAPRDRAAAAAEPRVQDSAQSAGARPEAQPRSSGQLPQAATRLAQPEVAAAFAPRPPAFVPIEIEARETIGLMDEGVVYPYWTFGGTVPGPMLRVRQGDTVEATLKNAPSSLMTHSIDLHAVTGPGGGASVTQVPPGGQATFRFQALNPGVYVYHCATPVVPVHVANGMYGLIVVEPPEGLPAVDREFYVMQGDFYADQAADGAGPRSFSMQKMLAEEPDYVVFNGASGALTGERALQAQVGERIRIFFGVGGPNLISSFHVIGEIFDRVAREGASEWSTNVQTTLVPAGGATIVEFTPEVPGAYILVDHSLARVVKGAAAVLHIEGPENPAVFAPVSAPPRTAGTGPAH